MHSAKARQSSQGKLSFLVTVSKSPWQLLGQLNVQIWCSQAPLNTIVVLAKFAFTPFTSRLTCVALFLANFMHQRFSQKFLRDTITLAFRTAVRFCHKRTYYAQMLHRNTHAEGNNVQVADPSFVACSGLSKGCFC